MQTKSPIKKVLIANRGEIAIRVARTCKNLGIKTVGIFSEQDKTSLHLNYCDEVFSLGEGTLAETYLNIPKIIQVLQKSKAGGVHPGYGFLSERAPFCEAVQKTGAQFIGPNPDVMISMGDKIQAKREMKKMGVPLLPGTEEGLKDLKEAKKLATQIGYPVLLKASAGGGGKGMRIVRSETELEKALESASREAKNYFGDSTVYLEKYLENPHHIEVQVLGDGFGGGGHVFDRECSIQRRHQKLIEESPSPLLERHPKAKEKILAVATQVVEQMKYKSAGTLEFLGDDQGGFYFLEMNTRLQVEHPVTEWVTGIDLVERQIRVAEGERLKPGPLCLKQNGYSIEVRIYAETPFEYLPTGGKISFTQFPQGPFVRVDSAIYAGYDVPTDFDPTLLKLSVWGQTRDQAIGRMHSALAELQILGVQSNQGLFTCVVQEQDFKDGNYGTPYLEKNREKILQIYNTELKNLEAVLVDSSLRWMKTKKTTSDFSSSSLWGKKSRLENLRGDL